MANEEHLSILKRGVRAWNLWRKDTKKTPDLRHANLSLANLCKANLRGANVIGVNLNGAELIGVEFYRANLSESDLSDANLFGVDLRDANVTGANFAGADLESAVASNAKLINANLSNADLTNADLSGADLSNANLGLANLTHADLSGADLREANLEMANLFRTNLSGAKLQNAIVGYTKFADCDLREAKDLVFVKHKGPSTIGIDTIYRSKGKIPENFLRECGVQEGFIMDMHSLVDAVEGIQFYSCFISYSSKDDEFARRLHGRMRDVPLRVWFAPEEMKGGNLLVEQIETAIRLYDKLLVVLSKASLQSEWVMTELRKARKAERHSGKRKLFPVRLVDFETLRDWECFDADTGKDLAVELREYFIPDFSNWKDHDQFEAAFFRLLKDLRTEARAK